MPHDDARPIARGDAFILPNHEPLTFGVVLSVRPDLGRAYVLMQSRQQGWCALPLVEQGRSMAEEFAVEGFA